MQFKQIIQRYFLYTLFSFLQWKQFAKLQYNGIIRKLTLIQPTYFILTFSVLSVLVFQ